MRTSSGRILTSHAGSLPRPDPLIEANRVREAGEAADEGSYNSVLRQSVGDIVRRQRELGIDIPGDGELGKATTQRINYGPWWRYSFLRMSGLAPGSLTLYELPPRQSGPDQVVLTSFADRRDRTRFAAAYADPASGITTGPRPPSPVCTGSLTYTGQQAIAADIANFKTALAAAGVDEGFMTAVAPGSAYRIPNTITRVTRSSSTPGPTRSARSTRRSSMPGWSCSSTIRRSPIIGTWSIPSRV